MDNKALIATQTGNLVHLEELLDQGINIDAQDDDGRTLLHHAANKSQCNIIKCLLKHGADFLITTDKGNTVLHIAILKCKDSLVKAILENVTRGKLRELLDSKTKAKGTTALHVAAQNNLLEFVVILLTYGANFEVANNVGQKPMDLTSRENLRAFFQLIDASFVKAKNGDKRLIRALEKCDEDDLIAALNCRNNDGRTITQVIMMNKHVKVLLKLLPLRLKYMPEERRDFDRMMCDEKKIEKLVELLKKYKEFYSKYYDAMWAFMDINVHKVYETESEAYSAQTVYKEQYLKHLCERLEKSHEIVLTYRKFVEKTSLTVNTKMKIIEELLEILGFDPDQLFIIVGEETCYYEKLPAEWKADYKFHLVLAHTVQLPIVTFSKFFSFDRLNLALNDNDIVRMVDILLNENVSLDIVDENHQTILSYAMEKGNPKIINLLLEAGAKITQKGVVSPLYLAVNRGHAKVVKLLLERVDIKDMAKFIDCQLQFESTTLHVAARKGRLDIVKMLLSYGATYCVVDGNGHTPLDVSMNKEVSDLFMLIDKCFDEAKKADVELIGKLKSMRTEEFMAVVGTKNQNGHTLDTVAAKAGAKDVAATIFKIMKKVKSNKK